jgi:hypothetical protein
VRADELPEPIAAIVLLVGHITSFFRVTRRI